MSRMISLLQVFVPKMMVHPMPAKFKSQRQYAILNEDTRLMIWADVQ